MDTQCRSAAYEPSSSCIGSCYFSQRKSHSGVKRDAILVGAVATGSHLMDLVDLGHRSKPVGCDCQCAKRHQLALTRLVRRCLVLIHPRVECLHRWIIRLAPARRQLGWLVRSDHFSRSREAADTLGKGSVGATLWLLSSLLTGAFVASVAATFGGCQSDLRSHAVNSFDEVTMRFLLLPFLGIPIPISF